MSRTKSESLKLDHRPWKVWMNTRPNPTVHLVSLYDLLFSDKEYDPEKGEYPTFWYDSNYFNLTSGVKVGHDILIRYNSILETTGSVIMEEQNYDKWEQYGIDLGLVTYDFRSKPRKIEIEKSVVSEEISYSSGSANESFSPWSVFSTTGQTIPNKLNFYAYDKEAAIFPVSVADVYINDTITPALIELYRGESANTDLLDFNSFNSLFSVGAADNSYSIGADIILSGKDTVFNSAITFEDGKDAYTRVCLNPTSLKVVRFVFAALAACITDSNGNSADIKSNLRTFIGTSNTGDSGALRFRFLRTSAHAESEIPRMGYGILDLGKNATFRELLKSVFVWIRAPFAADYVDPEDFNQNLNQTADVKHRNIMLSGKGDFNRYAESTSNMDDTASSRPYIPKNSPMKDYISPIFYNKTGKLIVREIMEEIIKDADQPDSLIGGVLSEPISVSSAEEYGKGAGAKISPTNFFDPESREEANDYNDVEPTMPTIIPKEGNVWADGRILSPTIDEIWYVIKKLISGHINDVDVKVNPTTNERTFVPSTLITSELESRDIAQPVTLVSNDYKNYKDTRLNEIKNVNYVFADEYNLTKIGDPLDFEITGKVSANRSGADAITVTEFITQPQEIQYKIYDIIKRFSDLVTTFNEKSKDKVLTRLNASNQKEDVYVDRGQGLYGERTIENFANHIVGIESGKTDLDVKQPKFDDTGGTTLTSYQQSVLKYQNTYYKTQFNWKPRIQPMSLRELEAAIQGNKYNIVSNFAFITSNFTVAGGLAKEIKVDDNIISGGGLYQFHRDYNFKIENPNTYFRPNGDTTTNEKTGGFDCQFDDLLEDTAIDESNIRLLNGTIKASKMPILKANYGISSLVTDEIGGYTGRDVYLSAAGTWQYIGERVRIPILRSEF